MKVDVGGRGVWGSLAIAVLGLHAGGGSVDDDASSAAALVVATVRLGIGEVSRGGGMVSGGGCTHVSPGSRRE